MSSFEELMIVSFRSYEENQASNRMLSCLSTTNPQNVSGRTITYFISPLLNNKHVSAGSLLTNRITEWTRIWFVLLRSETFINEFLTMCSWPGLWYVWQEAVRMTNEDVCNRMRTASEDSLVLLRQILRADSRHSDGMLHSSCERRQNTDVSQGTAGILAHRLPASC